MRTAAIARGSRDAAGMPPPVPVSEQGPSSRRVIVGYGFWLFLLSDIILFSTFFAAYAVLAQRNAGGPVGTQLFHRDRVLLETACLLASSFTCGIFSLAVDVRRRGLMLVFALLTFALGAVFLGIELAEFADMIGQGAGPGRSAFLSSFFTLVATHGLHVTLGILWLIVLMVQSIRFGLNEDNVRRLRCLSMFWHFLDLVWVGVFSYVYLVGVVR